VLFYRAAYAQAGQLKAAAWLQQALDAAGDDRSLQTALHEQARRHREPDPASFDAAWLAGAGPPLPGWLTVDPDLLQAARAWITTDTYEAERDYLTAHPELLASDADAAVTEALLDLDSEEAQRFEELRAAARTEGVEAAYRPLLLRVLAHEFIAADTGEQRQLLSQRRDDLLDDIVASELDRLAAADDQQVAVAAVAAGALVELARIDQHEPALAALESEAGFTPLLRDLARTPDSTPLAPTATLALVHASNATNAATARLYLAIAAATTDDLVVAGEQLDQAIASDPNQLPDWIAELAALGAQQPQVLALIPQLTTALTTSTPPSATATREQMSEG
jgi:hypothetical protein